MSFAQELKDFAAGFKATYHHPTEKDREGVRNALGEAVGDKAYNAGSGGRSPNPSTNWAQGDTPGGAASTPASFASMPLSALPTVEGGEASSTEMTDAVAGDLARAGIMPRYGERGALPTFARNAGSQALESDIAAAKAAIAAKESGGRYNAMGPVTRRGDRAYGKYQVMGENIPVWTRQAIGRAMTPQEFLNDPAAQEAVFEKIFGSNLNKFGFKDAASIWFSGKRASEAGNASDVNGTTVPNYIGNTFATFSRLRPMQRFADGGVVEALPQEVTDGTASADYMSSAPSRPSQDVYSYRDPQGMGDIADAAIAYGTKVFKLDRAAIPQADPQAQEGARAFAMNVGAARPEEIQTVEKTVDPEYKMSRSERQIAKYKAMYDYWMDHNEPEKASRAVFAMSMAAKDAARTYGIVATQALKRGDTKIAADAIAKAYDEVPDGRSIKVGDVNKDGVTFEMHDINGNITDKGKMAINEMIRVATGMVDGTEFLKQWGQIRERTDKRGAETERRRLALEQFNQADAGEGSERDYVATLSPEKRKAYFKLDPRDQRDLRNLHFKQLEQDRKQLNFQTRRSDAVTKQEHDDAMKLFGMSVRQKNWETTREQVMTNAERGFALKERDLSDRMARHGETREDKLKRWADIDKRILEGRTIKGVGKPSVEERKQQRIEDTASEALRSGIKGIDTEYGVPVDELGTRNLPTPEQAQRREEFSGAVAADQTFRQEMAARGKSRGASVVEETVLNTAIAGTPAAQKLADAPYSKQKLLGIASAISTANDIPDSLAAHIAVQAVRPDLPIRYVPDPANPGRMRVRIGDSPLLTIGSDTLQDLKNLRGHGKTINPGPALPVMPARSGEAKPSGFWDLITGRGGRGAVPVETRTERMNPVSPAKQAQAEADKRAAIKLQADMADAARADYNRRQQALPLYGD